MALSKLLFCGAAFYGLAKLTEKKDPLGWRFEELIGMSLTNMRLNTGYITPVNFKVAPFPSVDQLDLTSWLLTNK